VDADTNAIVLESLSYIAQGQMLCLACLCPIPLSRSNAMKPRSPILFHLLTGITICWLALSTVRADTGLPASGYPAQRRADGPRDDHRQKRLAVFRRQLSAHDGLVNAVNKYPSTTMWDSASYLAAMTAARELGIIDKAEFDRRMLKFLATLNTLVLFRNELPNKAYNTISGQKVDYTNKPGEIGFSALDIGECWSG
jgi:hypothetical protein